MGLFDKFKKEESSLMSKETILRLEIGTCMNFNHLYDVSIILKENEYCFFKDNCNFYEEKEVTDGYESNYNGLGMHIGGGVSFRTGKGKSKPIKKIKEKTYKGVLYLTNKRVIFVCDKYGFDIPITKITSVEGAYSIINIQVGKTRHHLSCMTGDAFIKALRELSLVQIDKIPEPLPINNVEINSDGGIDDPLYDLIKSAMIILDGKSTYIQRKVRVCYNISFQRFYSIIETLIENNIIKDERTENGNYTVLMTYEELLNEYINKKINNN